MDQLMSCHPLVAAFAAAALTAGCSGPTRGWLGELRDRTALISEAEEEKPPALPEASGTASGTTVPLFPLIFLERLPERKVLEVLWPLYESGRSSESAYLEVRPLYSYGSWRDRDRFVIFPFYWRLRERRELGERTVDHLWPLYGVHHRQVDLAPATIHHVLWPIFAFQLGEGRWKARVLPAAVISSGYLDRGWWLIPALKAGAGRGGWSGGNRWLYLLDPLFAYERYSIVDPSETESPDQVRTEIKLLGGFLGWESSAGRWRWRLFWFRI